MQRFLILIITLLFKFNILETSEFKLDIDPISPVYWISNEEIFINENDTAYIYNVKDRRLINNFDKKDGEIWGYENDHIFICKAENKVRNSIDEYSTHLTKLYLNREALLDIELKSTLEIVECRDDIILKTVFPIEEAFFIFSDDLYQLETYSQDIYSSNLKYFLKRDALGDYYLKQFSLKPFRIFTSK